MNNYEHIVQIIMNNLGNLGDEQLRVTGSQEDDKAAAALPILIECIKLHPESETYKPLQIVNRLIVISFKTLIFTLTLEMTPKIIFKKIESLCKIIGLSQDKDFVSEQDINSGYKILLQVLKKLKLKMIASDLFARDTDNMQRPSAADSRLIPTLGSEDDLGYIAVGNLMATLMQNHPRTAAQSCNHLVRNIGLIILRPSE